jgi:hypothetical protein
MATTHEPPVITPDRMWRDRAACRGGGDPERFFPSAETGPAYEAQVAAAKAVCTACPVRAECLTWALTELPYGIAGGMTEDERRRHRAAPKPRVDDPGELAARVAHLHHLIHSGDAAEVPPHLDDDTNAAESREDGAGWSR